jgi:hypothetical protein
MSYKLRVTYRNKISPDISFIQQCTAIKNCIVF